jgi:hypothetical protein
VPSLEDACALDDPIGIAAQFGVQLLVGDDHLGNIASRGKNPDSPKATATRTLGSRSIFGHVRPAAPGTMPGANKDDGPAPDYPAMNVYEL